jgi:hypothetical protein
MKRIALFRSGREHFYQLFEQLVHENVAVTDITTICALNDIYIELEQDNQVAEMLLKDFPFSDFDQCWFLGMPLLTTNVNLDKHDSNFSNMEWYAFLMSFFSIASTPMKGLGCTKLGAPPPLGRYRSHLALCRAGWNMPTLKYSIIIGSGFRPEIQSNTHDMWSVIFTEKEWFLIEKDFIQFEDMPTFSNLCWRTWEKLKTSGRIWSHLRFYIKDDAFYAEGLYDDLPQNQSDIRKIVLDTLY